MFGLEPQSRRCQPPEEYRVWRLNTELFGRFFFSLISSILEENMINIITRITSIFMQFFIKIQTNMSDQEKETTKIYDFF